MNRRKSHVIAELAYLGISPQQGVEGEFELRDGVYAQPVTSGNIRLAIAGLLQPLLEEAVLYADEDTELTDEDFDALEAALVRFRSDAVPLLPDMFLENSGDIDAMIAKLNELRNS